MNIEEPHPADPRIAFFDRHAHTWDDDANEVTRILSRLEELAGQIALVPGQSVLEIGCGTGRITAWLARQAHPGRVVAVDFSETMLAKARQRHVQAEFRLMDICGVGSEGERFDVVFCFHAFPHFRNHPQALRNIRALLNPGGQLIVLHLASSADLNHFHSGLAAPVCHDHMPSAEMWPKLLAAAELKLASLTDETGMFMLKATPDGPKDQ